MKSGKNNGKDNGRNNGKNERRKPKKMKIRASRDFEQLTVPEQMELAREVVKLEFTEKMNSRKSKEAVTSADVLIEMMGDEYINSFPKIVRPIVKKQVADLMNKRLRLAVEDVIKSAVDNGKVSKESTIRQMHSKKDFITYIFPDKEIPEYFKRSMQATINAYIKKVSAELGINLGDKTSTKVGKDEIKTKSELSQEELFLDTVSKYTYGYEFLSEDIAVFFAQKGHKSEQRNKFKSVEDATRFLRIQEIVKKVQSSINFDETSALTSISEIFENYEGHDNKKVRRINRTKSIVDGVMDDFGVSEQEREFIEKVLNPICKARLDVINKNQSHDNNGDR